MSQLRTVEILDDGLWKKVRLHEVKKGQIFRMFEDDNVPVIVDGKTEFIAVDDGTSLGVEV